VCTPLLATMFFLSLFFGHILLFIVVVIGLVLATGGLCFLLVMDFSKTGQLEAEASDRGVRDADADITDTTQIAELTAHAGGARATMGPRRSALTGIMLFALVAIAAARVEFGEVRGRFPCEPDIQCARDSTFHELRFRVYPLEATGGWTTTPWLFGPFQAGDVIPGPATCDPATVGQCYVMNGGNLTVSVRATPLFWYNPLTSHPVVEFPSNYEINTVRYAGNLSDVGAECERLRYHPKLFGDAGPCWKHLCTDGGDIVDTETVGVGPGCGLFEFRDGRAQLATGFEVHVTDTERQITTSVAFDIVRPGEMRQSVTGTVQAHVDTYTVPGGHNWVYPRGLTGGIVVCDWHAAWKRYAARDTPIDALPTPEPATKNASWYYVSPERILESYGMRSCGAHGPELSELAKAHTGYDCSVGPSFELGECLPPVYPGHILNGTGWAPEYVPPEWTALVGRLGLWERSGARRGVLHPAHPDDFLPGELSYEVVLRVATPVARTDKDNRLRLHSAVCLEENALQCVQDPQSLIVRISMLIGNRAHTVDAPAATATLECTYRGSSVNVSDVRVVQALKALRPGESTELAAVFGTPEAGISYASGTPTGRSDAAFDCTLHVDTPAGAYNATYEWSGTVSCSELVKVDFESASRYVDCNKADDEFACRLNEGTVGESPGHVLYFAIAGIAVCLDVTMIAYFVYHIRAAQVQKIPAPIAIK